MYANAHAATGAAIGLLAATHAPEPILGLTGALVAALASHIAMDKLGEANFGSTGAAILFELPFLGIIAALIWAAGQALGPGPALTMAAAAIAANLPDITDSRFYLTYVNRDRWPHRGWWICHKPGFVAVSLSRAQTVIASLILTTGLAALVMGLG